MKKKLLSLLLITSCLFSISSNAYAQEIEGVDGDEASVTVDSNFTVQPGDLSQVIISVPTNLDLEREGNFSTKYSVDDSVSARGTIASNKVVAVSVDPSVTYEDSADPTNVVDTDVDFSRGDILGVQYWTPTELEASNTELDSRPISITASTDKAGDFSGELTFKAKVYTVYGSVNGGSFSDHNDYASCNLNNNWDCVSSPCFYGKESGDILPVKNFSVNAACTGLTSFTSSPIYNGLSFNGTSNLRTLELNDNLTSLSLTSLPCLEWDTVVLPASLSSLTLENNSTLTSIGYDGENNLAVDNLKDMTHFKVSSSAITKVKVPCKVEALSFDGCTNLTEIILEDEVKLTSRCFYDCESLVTLDLTNVTSISQNCKFVGCDSLQEIYLSDKCTNFADAGTGTAMYTGFSGLDSSVEIFYNNTIERFKATKGYAKTESSLNGNVVHCTDGDITL